MARFAKRQRVFFVEEPIFHDHCQPHVRTRRSPEGVTVCVPHLPYSHAAHVTQTMHELLHTLCRNHSINPDVLWFYTPMALDWARQQRARVVVYDCMDELSSFAGAPAELASLEQELFGRAHLVFTGGHSLFDAKRALHASVHAFPSSVDAPHFGRARLAASLDPRDQASVPRPRLGFFGVIDERMDLALVDRVSRARPDWHLVFIGPIAKISEASLPRAPNIHWLGMKRYEQLPDYIAGWDVALMPFALNDATRFISPTKTLEYLAAGRPIVSTAVMDVVHPYRQLGLVRIADADSFVTEVEAALAEDPSERLARADEYLESTSWDRTWRSMADLVDQRLAELRVSKGASRAR